MAKTEEFQRPILTVDVVLFTLLDGRLHVLLEKRDRAPFAGQPALIGVYIRTQEDKDTHAAARRALRDKIEMEVPYLEQLAVFSGAERDPRGWSATVAYISMVQPEKRFLERFFPVDKLPNHIAFDHRLIIHWAVERIRNKASYSTLPLFVMPPKFTLTQLQEAYEAIMGTKMGKSNFRYKLKELQIVESAGEMSDPRVTNTRPAELFRAATNRKLWLFDSEITA